MKRIDTALPGLCLLEPVVHGDQRGFFMETWNRRTFEKLELTRDWAQCNYSRSQRNVLRGLHYQIQKPQAKLVRVTAGEVYDVAVDVRRGSRTFGQYVGATLSGQNRVMMFIPEGFAHGFYVLSDLAEFSYMCSDFYAPDLERGIAWDDPQVAIDWPLLTPDPKLSDRDRAHKRLAEMPAESLPPLTGSGE